MFTITEAQYVGDSDHGPAFWAEMYRMGVECVTNIAVPCDRRPSAPKWTSRRAWKFSIATFSPCDSAPPERKQEIDTPTHHSETKRFIWSTLFNIAWGRVDISFKIAWTGICKGTNMKCSSWSTCRALKNIAPTDGTTLTLSHIGGRVGFSLWVVWGGGGYPESKPHIQHLKCSLTNVFRSVWHHYHALNWKSCNWINASLLRRLYSTFVSQARPRGIVCGRPVRMAWKSSAFQICYTPLVLNTRAFWLSQCMSVTFESPVLMRARTQNETSEK